MVGKAKLSRLNNRAAEWEHLVQVSTRLPVRRRLFAEEGTRKTTSAPITGYVKRVLEKDMIEKQRRFGFKLIDLLDDDPSSPWSWEPQKQYLSCPPSAPVATKRKSGLPRLENYLLDCEKVDSRNKDIKSNECEHKSISAEKECAKPLQELEYCPVRLSAPLPVPNM